MWEKQHSFVRRVQQQDWDHPKCAEWVQQLEEAVAACPAPPVLVAHSLGCLAVAHWCATHTRPLHALVLVAVPDPDGPNFPKDATGFSPTPRNLGYRRIHVVSSEDDPYSGPQYVSSLVSAWGAEQTSLGAVGHINSESGLGSWTFGWNLVRLLGGGEPT